MIFMNTDRSNDQSYLDRIRINEGAEPCKGAFSTVLKKDMRRAVTLLNDRRLTFPCLYVLHEPTLRHPIRRYLNARTLTALRVIDQIKSGEASETDYFSSKRDSVYPVLRWIVETGSAEDIPEDDYEEILDVAISALINIYRANDLLPLVVDLIFKRNRRDSHIHDLVWALFRFHDPQVLRLIAQRLPSSNARDAELAAELLNIDNADLPAAKSGEEGREGYLHWLEKNQPYLYFTEESFQYSSKPVFCTVDLERKYLQKSAPSYDKHPLSSADDEEGQCVAAFKQLNPDEQKLLSEYSQKICGKSVAEWKAWLHAPVNEQIKSAKSRLEGEV